MKKSAFILFFSVLLSATFSHGAQLPGFYEYKVKKGDTLSSIAPQKTWDLIKRVNRIDERHLKIGSNILIPLDPENIPAFCPVPVRIVRPRVNEKVVYVFLESQYFGAYEKGGLVFWGPICSGKKGNDTPKGAFEVLWKSERYFSKKYDNTPMPYAICFSNRGYFLHQQALTGRPSSHGCLRLLMEDARKLYHWTGIGVKIEIF